MVQLRKFGMQSLSLDESSSHDVIHDVIKPQPQDRVDNSLIAELTREGAQKGIDR